MGIDLLRQQQRWKDGLMDIRHLMANLVQQVDRRFLFFLCFFHNICFGLFVCLFWFVIVCVFFFLDLFLLSAFSFCFFFFFFFFFFLPLFASLYLLLLFACCFLSFLGGFQFVLLFCSFLCKNKMSISSASVCEFF